MLSLKKSLKGAKMLLMKRRNDVRVEVIVEDVTVIRLKVKTRIKLASLKRGNDKRKNGVDTYDDVINRLIRGTK